MADHPFSLPPVFPTCFLELHEVDVWRGEQAEVHALRQISLTLREGESTVILGPNGSGKSTLLKLLTGEVRPAFHKSSYCRLFGESLWSLQELRHRIGIVMPEEVRRFRSWEIARNVVLSSLRGSYGVVRDMSFGTEEQSRAVEVMEKLGISPLAGRPFGSLSSGEKRRFLIARALIHRPGVLVLDEPSTALDFAAAAILTRTLRDLLGTGVTLVLVTHTPSEIPPEIDRALLLSGGSVLADGPKREVLTPDRLTGAFGVPLDISWHNGWAQVLAR